MNNKKTKNFWEVRKNTNNSSALFKRIIKEDLTLEPIRRALNQH